MKKLETCIQAASWIHACQREKSVKGIDMEIVQKQWNIRAMECL